MEPFDAVVLTKLLSTPRTRGLLDPRRSDDRDGEQRTLPTPDELLGRMRAGESALQPEFQVATQHAGQVLLRAKELGVTALAFGGPGYPGRLKEIPDPPVVLWCRGAPHVLEGPAVAIVGSRAGSPYAREVASQLGAELAARGVVVVSGLARGVDAAAHRGALTAGGPTVAVLGSGLDVVYPPEHGPLLEAIATDGVSVSELEPGVPPLAFHFPRRNRIISGLSLAVVVVEASERSGSLITARCAAEQGREVMAVPGNVLSGRCRGGHALIRDGAKVVESADDILEEIRPQVSGRIPAVPIAEDAGDDEDLLLMYMDRGESYDLDQLAERSGLEGAILSSRVLDLELRGQVVRLDTGRFSRS